MERVRMRDCPDKKRRADNGNAYSGTGDNAKTAAYTFTEADCGKCFSNTGASGSVTFTLPDGLPLGWWIDLHAVANQAMVLAATAVNGAATLSTDNTQDGIAMARVIMRPDGKYSALLAGTWT